jgi:hypothetical protein
MATIWIGYQRKRCEPSVEVDAAKGVWEDGLIIPEVVRAHGEDAWSGETGR